MCQSCHGTGNHSSHKRLIELAFVGLVLSIFLFKTGSCQEVIFGEHSAEITPRINQPFGFRGPTTKPFPPLDCLQCYGPTPYAPCHGCVREFKYYGTCIGRHGSRHNLNHCSDGECGCFSEAIAHMWIQLHKKCEIESRCSRCSH